MKATPEKLRYLADAFESENPHTIVYVEGDGMVSAGYALRSAAKEIERLKGQGLDVGPSRRPNATP